MRTHLMIAYIVGGVLLVLALSEKGVAEGTRGAQLSIASQGASTGVWVLDGEAARLKLCMPPLQLNMPPDCTAWGSMQ